MKILRGLTILLVVGLVGGTWGGRVQARAHEFTTRDLPTAPATSTTFAFGINQQGDIVGYYFDSKAHTHSFLLRGGKYTTLNDPKATPRRTLASMPAATVPRLTVRRVRMPANPVAAVKLLVGASGAHPIADDPCYPAKVSASYLQARGCPVTLRLQRLLRTYLPGGTHAGYGSPIIRFGGSNGNPFPFGFHLDHLSNGSTQVTVTPHFYHAPERTTFQLARVSIGWLVDNTYCAGRPATSIYQPIPASCFTTSDRTSRVLMRGIASRRSES